MAIKSPILGAANSLDKLIQALQAFFTQVEAEVNRLGPGSVIFYAGQSPPEGWIEIEATRLEFNQSKYPDLYSILGDTWGDTATTFFIPAIADLPTIPGAGFWIIKV